MDSTISANTLFHFTTTKQNLLSILDNGIYSRYSLENYENLIDGTAEIVFPMACFCDIPLSLVKRHTGLYGKYAIGLTKTWGMQHGVNPVIYTYPNSTTANLLNEISGEFENFFQISDGENENIKSTPNKKRRTDFITELKDLLSDPSFKYTGKAMEIVDELADKLGFFLRYIKPYEGKFYRNDNYLEHPVKFYEEREWRFVPSRDIIMSSNLKDSYIAEYYKTPVKRRAINMRLAKKSKLLFKPNDIRFIILQKESEIPDMLNHLERIFESKATSKELKLLVTRIISLEQIIDDI